MPLLSVLLLRSLPRSYPMADSPNETLAETKVPAGEALVPPVQDAAAPAARNGHPHEARAEAEDGLTDWGVQIDVPPPRPAQMVTIRFVEGGRRPLALPTDPKD
jgi:hypothetical protein